MSFLTKEGDTFDLLLRFLREDGKTPKDMTNALISGTCTNTKSQQVLPAVVTMTWPFGGEGVAAWSETLTRGFWKIDIEAVMETSETQTAVEYVEVR